LAHAYDTMLQALDGREKLIESRLADSMKHFGVSERILHEKKNFDKELEDIGASFQYPNRVQIEDVLSVQQQIHFVIESKNLTAEEKFAQLMSRALNPFIKPNWGREHLKHSEHPALDEHKFLDVPDPRLTRSMLRTMREGSDFTPESEAMVQALIEDVRGRMDLPFDELYHKEKALVQAVIKAQTDLKEKEADLKSPIAD
jgi:hypothetical protein